MKKKKFSYNLLWLLLAFLVFYSCSVKKYIPSEESLYTGGDIELETETKIKDRKEIEAELNNLLRPEPNSKFLGVRWGLLTYYKNQKEKPGFINKFLYKQIGEEPVYLSDVDVVKTEDLIQNRLENRGFFNNIVTSSVDQKNKTATTQYQVQVSTPYKLNALSIDMDSLPIYDSIQKSIDQTLLEADTRFDLALFKEERQRIDDYLKARGYYNFNDDFLIFEADTNQYDTKKFDLYLRMKQETPPKSKIPYKINSVEVYPNYSVTADETAQDTTIINGIQYIQHGNFFKPERLDPFVLLDSGQYYNPQTSKFTSNRLSKIGVYKYTTIRYDKVKSFEEGDSIGLLDAKIFLSPKNKHSLRAEVQANSKSNNYVGPALALTYTNRNFFKGGEIFSVSPRFGYEKQIAGGNNNAGLTSLQLGLKSDLIFPRILFPYKFDLGFQYEVPKTKISAGIEYLDREEFYTTTSILASFGYTWNANRYVFHELTPFGFNYSSLSNVSEEFQDILDGNQFLARSFEQRFIAGLSYGFVYNEISDVRKKNPIYFATNFEIAGNVLDLISGKPNEEGVKEIMGLEFAQFVRGDVDFRYQLHIDDKQMLVARLFGGIGIAYGNSESMPYAKQYFSGGPFSVRAFRIRSLGPGTYEPGDEDGGNTEDDNSQSYLDQTGDIRLEANLEYRFPLVPYVKGALFADAGNVWLRKINPDIPGGEFSSGFLKELGVGVGAGVRVDIQGFVIRMDLAAPIHKPSERRYNFDLSNPILNFAFGYPF
ncbi:translocation and assembly module lipoprotein TamL [Galbibacter mesophilus]|uniref:translocation and assembly module lipoprotein TamL n=1 Tax=Galbibacter mesophilus TaxID=379069 RepID=UPI00191E3710|nr:BamA/TamA family outer membrane protein [Galbibacter mesophilus]MCM5663561.1 outer membrane protein assembly factor [Galbibacter mesophilus]